VAVNYAGFSVPSGYATIYSCVDPTGFAIPTQGTITSSSVDLDWAEPTYDGGCSLTGFAIFRDDGAGGSFTEVHSASLNTNPHLSTFTVTDLPAAGLTVKFYMKAFNAASKSVSSSAISVVIADVPSTPGSAPTSDSSITSGSQLKILYTAPSDGGSPITNYEV